MQHAASHIFCNIRSVFASSQVTRVAAARAMSSVASVPMISPATVGTMSLQHKVVMSPMTRTRMAPVTEVPTDLTVLYHGQRASPGGLIISECAYPCRQGRGYVRAPGMVTDEQVAGWKRVTDEVHSKKGHIFCQLFHAGRVSHSDLAGEQPVAPSAIAMAGELYVEGGVKKPYEVPRALEASELPGIAKAFATAAKRAVHEAGFDGVEIHAGNGYLLQQFLGQATNQRSDQYGGSVANRARLLLEVLDACAAEVGPSRVSVKLQPGVTFSDLLEPEVDVLAQLEHLGPQLASRGLAYVCLSSLNGEPYYKFVGLSEPNLKTDVFKFFRERYSGSLMINGGLAIEQGNAYCADGTADLVSFGSPFIANANLPELVAAGYGHGQLNAGGYDMAVWYSKDPSTAAVGYTDWPLVKP